MYSHRNQKYYRHKTFSNQWSLLSQYSQTEDSSMNELQWSTNPFSLHKNANFNTSIFWCYDKGLFSRENGPEIHFCLLQGQLCTWLIFYLFYILNCLYKQKLTWKMINVLNEVSKWINISLEFQQFLFDRRLENMGLIMIFHRVFSGISLSL